MSRSSSGIPRAKMFLRLTRPTSWIKLVLSSHTGVGRKGLGPKIDVISTLQQLREQHPMSFPKLWGPRPMARWDEIAWEGLTAKGV